jgi:hypothetical protein
MPCGLKHCGDKTMRGTLRDYSLIDISNFRKSGMSLIQGGSHPESDSLITYFAFLSENFSENKRKLKFYLIITTPSYFVAKVAFSFLSCKTVFLEQAEYLRKLAFYLTQNHSLTTEQRHTSWNAAPLTPA